jgi:CRP/FNR family transcriptional regulator, cyclic AMP receptor protein
MRREKSRFKPGHGGLSAVLDTVISALEETVGGLHAVDEADAEVVIEEVRASADGIDPLVRRHGASHGFQLPVDTYEFHSCTGMLMHRSIETLANIGLFQSLDARAIGLLDRQCSWRRAAAGEWILDYQAPSNDVFFVVSGAVRVMIHSAGREVLLRQIEAREFFGELAAIDGQPRSSGIIAETHATIARMKPSVFRETVHSHPDVCDRLLALLTSQVRMLANRVSEFSTLDVRHRIYAELLRLARPEVGNGARGIVSPPPRHAEIAARVSTRRETVTRELKSLEVAGLVERRRGALVLADRDRLRRDVEQAFNSG